MRRTLCAAALLAALLSPLVLCGEEPAADSALSARCFYGRSSSRSSHPTALNGELFVVVVTKNRKEATFKIVFHHGSKFHRTVVNIDLGQQATDFRGHFAIDGTKVPFHMQMRDGTILGELGTGLDKGVIPLEDFDKGVT